MRLTQRGYLASDIDDSDVSRTFARVRPLQNQGFESPAAVAVPAGVCCLGLRRSDFDSYVGGDLHALMHVWTPRFPSFAHVGAGQESPSDDDEMPLCARRCFERWSGGAKWNHRSIFRAMRPSRPAACGGALDGLSGAVAQPDEPAEQHVVLRLLHELALRANAEQDAAAASHAAASQARCSGGRP